MYRYEVITKSAQNGYVLACSKIIQTVFIAFEMDGRCLMLTKINKLVSMT